MKNALLTSMMTGPMMMVVLFLSPMLPSLQAAPPTWATNPVGNHYGSMAVYARVNDSSGNPISNTNSLLAAFIGTNVAGVAGLSGPTNARVFQLPVYADGSNAQVTYQVYDGGTDQLKSVNSNSTFADGTSIGTMASPRVFAVSNGTIIIPTNPMATFASFAVNFAGTSANDDHGSGISALAKYAFGGTTNGINTNQIPTHRISNGYLKTDVYVRTDDPSLSVMPEVCDTLSGSNNWTTSGLSITVLGSTNINGVPLEHRAFSLPVGSAPRKFMRIRVQIGN